MVKIYVVLFFLMVSGHLSSKSQSLEIIGKNFVAFSVANTDSTSQWYEKTFGLKLLKEIKPADGTVHIRIIGNDSFMIELVQLPNSKPLTACSIENNQTHLLQGIFKVGIFVKDIVLAERYFKGKNIAIMHGVFEDTDTHTKSLILEDPNGNLLQVLEQVN